MCARSLLTIGEALSCNYGNKKWVKIIFQYLQYAYLDLANVLQLLSNWVKL